jgi:hypothetical protein
MNMDVIFLSIQFITIVAMRKSIAVLIFGILAITVSACSVYTCPTYAKSVKEQPKTQEKI